MDNRNNIPEKFLKPYDPSEAEKRIYSMWEKEGLFNPETCIEKGYTKADATPFTIMMPPPNVTGVLHMGHAMMLTIEDIMIRYKRMQGFRTLWLPGTDHAAIATQSKVEKIIQKEEKKSRHDLGREELLNRVRKFAQESHDTIASQVRVMGSSCDWSREAFTLDEPRNIAVNTMFKKMYDDGLIYRGHRIVNWDPKGQTTIADDEIVYVEEKTKFYYFKYGPFTIGTARPETKFGDKYVVMHPQDKRYTDYKHGDKLTVEWINGPIESTIIKDEAVDMEFGTGVMTITPWHSVVDFELAEKHKLDKEQIIDEYGKLLPVAGEFAGLKIKDARSKIVEKLHSKGLLVDKDGKNISIEEIEDYTHNVSTAERTGGIIEPQIKLQWFVAVNKEIPGRDGKTLKDLMREPVASGDTKIIPEYFDKTYFHWIDNLRDWCISRQIWYGHRVPVWYRSNPNKYPEIKDVDNLSHEEQRDILKDRIDFIKINNKTEIVENLDIYCDVNPPTEDGWIQDEDTLDTWFSSSLWTFSTLGWPEKTKDLEIYHPTDVLETGYEILFFWVARMILMTEYALGTVPFKTVYLHGTVRDGKGQKMSKSLGNGIDPLDIAEKFGADAGRMALIVGTAPGTDSKISEDKIKGYKHFANKIWNITRFVLENTDKDRFDLSGVSFQEQITEDADKKHVEEFHALDCLRVTKEMDEYKFHLVAPKIYDYVWKTFADKIIEELKPRLGK
jgi:valyl-tRNA synthetase